MASNMATLTIIIKDVKNMDEFIDDIQAFLDKKDVMYKLNDVESEPVSVPSCCICKGECFKDNPWYAYDRKKHMLCSNCYFFMSENTEHGSLSNFSEWDCEDALKCIERYDIGK